MFTKFRKALLLMLLGATSGLAIIIPWNSSTRLATETSLNLYQYQKPSDNLAQWIDKLEEYECKDCPIGFSRIDSNGLRSYGCLQFQKDTFLLNLKKYYPETYNNIQGNEWQNLIYDCDFQKQLAYKMIKDNPENIWHWALSVKRGLGKP